MATNQFLSSRRARYQRQTNQQLFYARSISQRTTLPEENHQGFRSSIHQKRRTPEYRKRKKLKDINKEPQVKTAILQQWCHHHAVQHTNGDSNPVAANANNQSQKNLCQLSSVNSRPRPGEEIPLSQSKFYNRTTQTTKHHDFSE